jgi:hypothetical protein
MSLPAEESELIFRLLPADATAGSGLLVDDVMLEICD